MKTESIMIKEGTCEMNELFTISTKFEKYLLEKKIDLSDISASNILRIHMLFNRFNSDDELRLEICTNHLTNKLIVAVIRRG